MLKNKQLTNSNLPQVPEPVNKEEEEEHGSQEKSNDEDYKQEEEDDDNGEEEEEDGEEEGEDGEEEEEEEDNEESNKFSKIAEPTAKIQKNSLEILDSKQATPNTQENNAPQKDQTPSEIPNENPIQTKRKIIDDFLHSQFKKNTKKKQYTINNKYNTRKIREVRNDIKKELALLGIKEIKGTVPVKVQDKIIYLRKTKVNKLPEATPTNTKKIKKAVVIAKMIKESVENQTYDCLPYSVSEEEESLSAFRAILTLLEKIGKNKQEKESVVSISETKLKNEKLDDSKILVSEKIAQLCLLYKGYKEQIQQNAQNRKKLESDFNSKFTFENGEKETKKEFETLKDYIKNNGSGKGLYLKLGQSDIEFDEKGHPKKNDPKESNISHKPIVEKKYLMCIRKTYKKTKLSKSDRICYKSEAIKDFLKTQNIDPDTDFFKIDSKNSIFSIENLVALQKHINRFLSFSTRNENEYVERVVIKNSEVRKRKRETESSVKKPVDSGIEISQEKMQEAQNKLLLFNEKSKKQKK